MVCRITYTKKRVLIVFEVFYTVLYCMYVIVKCIVENNQVFQYIFSLFYAVLPCTAIYCTVLDFGWTPKLFKAKQEGKTTAGFCLSRHFTNKKRITFKVSVWHIKICLGGINLD